MGAAHDRATAEVIMKIIQQPNVLDWDMLSRGTVVVVHDNDNIVNINRGKLFLTLSVPTLKLLDKVMNG